MTADRDTKAPDAEADIEDIEKILKKIKGRQKNAGIREFMELFSDEIYSYPMRYFNMNEDDAGDFYLYAFERLRDGKRLSSFKGDSRFRTWFFSVLRNLVIDFLRTKRNQIKTVSLIRMDAQGNLVDSIENVPDFDLFHSAENDLFLKLEESLQKLKIDQRVLFKLTYIHYLDLTPEEFEWLRKKNAMRGPTLLKKIAEMKERSHSKSSDVDELEGKLSFLFNQILALEQKIHRQFQDHPEWPYEKAAWNEEYTHPDLDIEVIKQIQDLSKKKKRQMQMIEKQKKKIPAVKASYKEVAELTGSSKGVVSVQVLRILEKLNQSLEN